MSALTQYASPVAIVRTNSHVLPPSQVMDSPASLPRSTWAGLRGSIQMAWLSSIILKKPPALSSVRNVFPPSSDFAGCTPPTQIVSSFVGSMRIWLKYNGRPLQLLTAVHDLPLLSDR